MENSIEFSQEEILSENEWRIYVQETLEKEVCVFWRKATKAFGMENLPVPPVEWTGKTSKAAYAKFYLENFAKDYSLHFNLELATNSVENFAEFRDQIVPHEICHLIANIFWGKDCVHGIEWQATMTKFGLNPARTHSMDVTGIDNKNFVYKCPECGQEYRFSKIRHERQQKTGKYSCGVCHCKKSLRFSRDLAPKSAILGLV